MYSFKNAVLPNEWQNVDKSGIMFIKVEKSIHQK